MSVVPANDRTIALAARALRGGGLVAFPTETVYGLGADATNGEAVASIFEMKGRPQFNPLIVHVSRFRAAQTLADFSLEAQYLAREFWPGALTLVLPLLPHSPIADLVTACLDTIALRSPAHPVAQALLEEAGVPVAAPSANLSGHVSPTTAEHVADDLGNGPDFILDAGTTALGLESTIVDVTGARPRLLRPGAVPTGEIEEVVGKPLVPAVTSARPNAPGQLESHYAPRAPVRLDATEVGPGEVLLAFGGNAPKTDAPVINLSPNGDLRQAAARLFSALRELDALDPRAIAAMTIPDQGLGEAINDRLRRAAAPRLS